MAHTALSHLEELKKKELAMAAMTMSQEEFDQLVEERNALIADSSHVMASTGKHSNPVTPTMTNSNNASAAAFKECEGGAW